MPVSTAVPVAISPEAAARIGQLRVQSEVEQMIRDACSVFSHLEGIQVNLYHRFDLGEEPGLCIDLYGGRPYDRLDQDERKLIRLLVTKFSPQILERIIVDYHPGKARAG